MIQILLILLILLTAINLLISIFRSPKTSNDLNDKFTKIEQEITRVDSIIRDEFSRNRNEIEKSSREHRLELSQSLDKFEQKLNLNFKEIREVVENKLKDIQEDNNKKLEEMRKTVDEKLQETVEKRFDSSFKIISERLEQVHKGLGEMQTLASGVGDLKKVLTNVKTRGNLGEIQLATILDQILSPQQFIQNAQVKKNSQQRVEFAIKLPNKNSENQDLLLPIDSKFPIEDYLRFIEAMDHLENYSKSELENLSKQFENSVKRNARDIREKYINPPITTDFAIMFVPTEGLYAEILRRPGLFESLQKEYKITVVGPTNLVAFLSSLQMGFKTLAIEKRSSEVWEILGAVKTEFSRFGKILDKTKKKLQEASNVIDTASVRSRAIERKLKTVQELPEDDSVKVLGNEFIVEKSNDGLLGE